MVDAATTATGGHYLRSCDAAAAAAAAAGGPSAGARAAAAGGAVPPPDAFFFGAAPERAVPGSGGSAEAAAALPPAPIPPAPLSPLHHEMAAFAAAATPTPAEVAGVQAAVAAVDQAARELWPQSQTVLFGSQVGGCLGRVRARPASLGRRLVRSWGLFRHPFVGAWFLFAGSSGIPWPELGLGFAGQAVPAAETGLFQACQACGWQAVAGALTCGPPGFCPAARRPPGWRSLGPTWTSWCWGWAPS